MSIEHSATVPIIKGLQLCNDYYYEIIRPRLVTLRLPNGDPALEHLACGLAGEGSDCLGYDDELSRDHDWGPGFSLWYDESDPAIDLPQLEEFYAGLPKRYKGFERLDMPEAAGRVGPASLQFFFRRLIGKPDAPQSNMAWLSTPESALAAATNGKVFEDQPGKYSAIRSRLLAYYPEPVRLKKIAARLTVMGQAGQYNLPRCIKRHDWIAARHAVNEFMQLYMSCAHLLSYKYRPYYKWAARSMAELEGWSIEYEKLMQLNLITIEGEDSNAHLDNLIAELCALLLQRIDQLGLGPAEGDFLPHRAAGLQSTIKDEEIRRLPLMYG